MIYIKSILAGMVLLIGCVALFTFALAEAMLDARWIMGHYPFITLPTMLAIFVMGFLWQFQKTLRRSTHISDTTKP